MTTEHTFLIADNQFITQVGLRWLIRQTYTDALIHEVADKRALLAENLGRYSRLYVVRFPGGRGAVGDQQALSHRTLDPLLRGVRRTADSSAQH